MGRRIDHFFVDGLHDPKILPTGNRPSSHEYSTNKLLPHTLTVPLFGGSGLRHGVTGWNSEKKRLICAISVNG